MHCELLLGSFRIYRFADTFLVTKTTDDNGPCTADDCALREAVIAANANPGMDIIDVPAGTYQLTISGEVPEGFSMSGDLDIRDDLEIRGESAETVTIVGADTDRVMEFFGAAGFATLAVSVSDVTVTGGRTESGGGGLAFSNCIATISNSTIRGNTAVSVQGGGIWAGLSTLALIDSTIANNTSDVGGGGIFLLGINISSIPSVIHIFNSTISGNSAGNGGGVFIETSAANFVHTSIVNNQSIGPGSAFLASIVEM